MLRFRVLLYPLILLLASPTFSASGQSLDYRPNGASDVTRPQARSTNPIGLNAGIHDQSPDGRLVQVGGGIFSESTKILGWTYDWGDGSTTTGVFTTLHRYSSPGDYTVTVTGYDDAGNTKQTTFPVTVPVLSETDVARVEVEPTVVGLKPGEVAEVDIKAYDAQGNELSLNGRTVDIFNLWPENISTEINGSTLSLEAPDPLNRDASTAIIYVYVDNQEATQPVNVVLNRNSGDFRLLSGEYTVSYLPEPFFNMNLSADDYVEILDLAFDLQNESIDGKWPEPGKWMQAVSYAPPAFGASGHPLLLGDAALPEGDLPIFVGIIFHEMGHNFSSVPILFNGIGIPGAFYQETIAEWYVQYVENSILDAPPPTLSPTALQILEDLSSENRQAHLQEFEEYVAGGMQFNYDLTGGGSHPLVQIIFEYSDSLGWDRIEDFMQQFDHSKIPTYGNALSQHGGWEPIENRVTIMAVALSFAFETDVRRDFEALNFPLNDDLFRELTPAPGSPANLVTNSPSNLTVPAGFPVCDPPSVFVSDNNGFGVPNAEVTFTVIGGDGSVSGAVATTNERGVATVGSWTPESAGATHTLTATVAGLSGRDVAFSADALPADNPQFDPTQSCPLQPEVGSPFSLQLQEQTKLCGTHTTIEGPDWLTLSQDGALSGTPTTAGRDTLTAQVQSAAETAQIRIPFFVENGIVTLNAGIQNQSDDGSFIEVNGFVGSNAGDIVQAPLYDWNDGSSNRSWFPATHTYAQAGTYTITVTAEDEQGNEALACFEHSVSGVIPVELTTFTGTLDDDQIHLTWETASETNNAGFEVQRRTTNDKTYQQIGFVEGMGTTSAPQSYHFTDTAPPFETDQLTYRLRQVDFDGAFEFSPEVEIDLGAPETFSLHEPYPNPVRGSATLRYELPQAGPVRLDVYDMLGRHVATLVGDNLTAGRKETILNTVELASGLYFVRLQANGQTLTRKVTVVR